MWRDNRSCEALCCPEMMMRNVSVLYVYEDHRRLWRCVYDVMTSSIQSSEGVGLHRLYTNAAWQAAKSYVLDSGMYNTNFVLLSRCSTPSLISSDLNSTYLERNVGNKTPDQCPIR